MMLPREMYGKKSPGLSVERQAVHTLLNCLSPCPSASASLLAPLRGNQTDILTPLIPLIFPSPLVGTNSLNCQEIATKSRCTLRLSCQMSYDTLYPHLPNVLWQCVSLVPMS